MKLLAAFFKKAPSSVVVELDEDVAPVQELEATMKAYGFSIEDLETSFVIDSPTRIPEIYLKCFHLHKGELIFDQSTIVEQNFLFWIPERTELFKRLDIEFMRAAETEDKKLLQEVKIQKAFLRDLPTWTIIKIGEIVSKKRPRRSVHGILAQIQR